MRAFGFSLTLSLSKGVASQNDPLPSGGGANGNSVMPRPSVGRSRLSVGEGRRQPGASRFMVPGGPWIARAESGFGRQKAGR